MNKKAVYIIIVCAALLCGVIVYLVITMRNIDRRNEYLMSQVSRPAGRNGRPQEDPYISREVKNTIMKHRAEIGQCYSEYLAKKPAVPSGRIKYDWRIDEDGKAVSPEVVFSDFGDKEFEKCMAAKISAWNFPPPPFDREKYVEHVFDLKDKPEDPQ